MKKTAQLSEEVFEVRRLRNGKALPQGNRGDDETATKQRPLSMTANHNKEGSNSTLPQTDSQFDLWHMERENEKNERQTLVLWRRPLQTLYYCFMEVGHLLAEYSMRLLRKRSLIVFLFALFVTFGALYAFDGPHQAMFAAWRKVIILCLYWIGLGILSSVGLGTGLHTFLIYLGPFIAQVTMAAFECHSLDFPEPPFPDEIHCPSEKGTGEITLWAIMSKVRLEAFMWGAGTAIGELPPYFMARAARLSGMDPDNEDFDEFAELIHDEEKRKKNKGDAKLPLFQRLKLSVHHFVQRVGFLGILLCASVPNPLFDLAGITCGHFLIPFWTFFGATLIGKAIIKMHIQKLFVIVAFSKHHMEIMLSWVAALPGVGKSLHNFLEAELKVQREKFRASPAERSQTASAGGKNIIGWIFEKLVMIMILYFVLSIVNSMAHSYHKRIYKRSQSNNAVPSKKH